MCLITYKAPGAAFDFAALKNSHSINDDGWGVLIATRDAPVKVLKALTGFAALQSALSTPEIIKSSVLVHQRFATHGPKNMKNCHPFRVLEKEIHGEDVWLMHNGVMDWVRCYDKNYSDTWHFMRDNARPFLLRHGGVKALEDPVLLDRLGAIAGRGNKLAFMTEDGSVYLANEHEGTWANQGTTWYSNEYSITPYSNSWQSWEQDNWEQQYQGQLVTTEVEEYITTFDLLTKSPLEILNLVYTSPRRVRDWIVMHLKSQFDYKEHNLLKQLQDEDGLSD